MTDIIKLDFQDFWGQNEDLFENGLTVSEEKVAEKLYNRVISCAEHQIADLKANFDYVLEGKDLENKEKDRQLNNWYLEWQKQEKKIKTLGERCNQLLKDKGDLTDKITDIKANCDLAIEGRDVKIKELEKENAELRKNGFTVSAMTEQQLKVAIEKGEQLDKENAELKGIKDVATLIRANNDTVITLMQLNNKLVSKSQQLTKAKEEIRSLYSIIQYRINYENNIEIADEMWRAKQFLNSEVEK